tara:strand:+ start:742 stop:3030 length:2289 start_codon:yes stop_codon:yes gene_type:complete
MPPTPTFDKTKTSDSKPDQQVSDGGTSEFNDQRDEKAEQMELQQGANNSASVSEISELQEKANGSSAISPDTKAKTDKLVKETSPKIQEIKELIKKNHPGVKAYINKLEGTEEKKKAVQQKLDEAKPAEKAKTEKNQGAYAKLLGDASKGNKEIKKETTELKASDKEIGDKYFQAKTKFTEIDKFIQDNNIRDLQKADDKRLEEIIKDVNKGIKQDLKTIELKDQRTRIEKIESFVSKVEEVTDVHMGSTGESGAANISSLDDESFHKNDGVGDTDVAYGNASAMVGMSAKGAAGIFVFAANVYKIHKGEVKGWEKIDAGLGAAQGVLTSVEGASMAQEQGYRTNVQNLKGPKLTKEGEEIEEESKLGLSGNVGYSAGAVADILSAGRNVIGVIHNVCELWKSSEKLTGDEKQKLRVEAGIKTLNATKSITSATGKIDALANQGSAVLTGIPMAAGIIGACKELLVVFDMFLRWGEWKDIRKELTEQVEDAANAFNKKIGFKLSWEHQVETIAEGKRKFAALKVNKQAYKSKEEEVQIKDKLSKEEKDKLKKLNNQKFTSFEEYYKTYVDTIGGEDKVKVPPLQEVEAELDEYILWRELLIQKDKAADRDLLKFYTTIVKLSGSIAKIIPDATALAVGVGMTTGAALVEAGAAGIRETKQAARDSKAQGGLLGKLAPTADTSKTTAAKKAWRIEQSQQVCNKVIELQKMKRKAEAEGKHTAEEGKAGEKVILMLKACGVDYEKTEPKDLAQKVYKGFLKREM